jgi:hypothetical protein
MPSGRVIPLPPGYSRAVPLIAVSLFYFEMGLEFFIEIFIALPHLLTPE